MLHLVYPLQQLQAHRVLEASGKVRLKSCSGLSVRKQHLDQFCLVYCSFAIVMTALTEPSLRHFIVLLAPCTCEQMLHLLRFLFQTEQLLQSAEAAIKV